MKFEVKTGYGYFKDKEGRIIAKAILPKGEHPLEEGFFYEEVNSQEELDKIEVYFPSPPEEEIKERKIRDEMRRMLREQAITNLKIRGEF